jgi:dTDP-4-dehydrorhamnose reductase
MDSILVTGATGLLGRSLVPLLRKRGHNIVTQARVGDEDFLVDLADRNNVYEMLSQIQPTAIINLVGLTSVEVCQEQTNAAYLANTKTVENIVQWIRQSGKECHLIQISTDHLYDGSGPHTEEIVTLTNNYALTKYSGELAAGSVSSTILRTNFIGLSKATNRESLTDWVFVSLKNGEKIKVFEDVFFSPLSMTTLSEMINVVIEQKPIGTYNLGSRNGMSKADLGFAFAEYLGLKTKTMKRINSDQSTFLKTYRPKDMRLDSTKFEKALQLIMPNLSDEVKLAAKDYL